MSLSEYIPDKFLSLFSDPGFAGAIKGYTKYLLKEDLEFREEVRNIVVSELDNSFDSRLITSELRPVKRIAELETVTGLDDFSIEDEDRVLNIPERIEVLEEGIRNGEFGVNVSPRIEREPTTKTEYRATLLVKALETSGKDHFTANEIMNFLKCKLPDSCKIDDAVKNIRKVKQDVIRAAKEMFPRVELNKKKTGHREVRLILKS